MVGLAISGTLSYFAIPLIWFHDRKLGAALGKGLHALVVNWQPFLALGVGLLLLFLPLALVSGALFSLAGGGLLTTVVLGLITILLLLFQLMLFGTQYCAFRDIFGMPAEAAAPPEAGGDGQLVA
jgi:hypothetical protein